MLVHKWDRKTSTNKNKNWFPHSPNLIWTVYIALCTSYITQSLPGQDLELYSQLLTFQIPPCHKKQTIFNIHKWWVLFIDKKKAKFNINFTDHMFFSVPLIRLAPLSLEDMVL